MTVPSLTNRMDYTGNGSVSTYSFTFKVLDEADLRLTVRDTDGVETELALTTDYTVTGVGSPSGGSISLVSAGQAWLTAGKLTTDYHLTIRRDPDPVQETDIANQGSFYPEVHEDALDRLTMVAQKQQDELDRSVKLPETVAASGFAPTLPADIASLPGGVIQVNADGDGLIVATATLPNATVTPYMETVLDDLNAAAARTTLGFAGGLATNGSVDAAAIDADAVTTVKILNGNVTLAKVAEAARTVLATYIGASAGGTDTYAINPNPAYTAYATGMTVVFKVDVANTGAATLNVNSLGAKDLTDREGSALTDNVLKAGAFYTAVYDGTQFRLMGVLSHSEVWLYTGNGLGAVNTKIRRFTTTGKNVGTSITYADSANAAASFTINTAGVYSIAYVEHAQSTPYGLSLNSASLTTNFGSLAASERIGQSSFASGDSQNSGSFPAVFTGWLAAGDVVRPHVEQNLASTYTMFRITRIS